MPSILLMPYYVRVKEPNGEGYLQFGALPDNKTLRSIFVEYLESRTGVPANDQEKRKILGVNQYACQDAMVSGEFRTGEYGYESDLVDITTGEITYSRQTTDAELLPFYFLFNLPDDSECGVVLLEKFGVFSAKTALERDFNSFLPAAASGGHLALELSPIAPPETAASWLQEGRIVNVRLVKHQIPTDVADAANRANLPLPSLKNVELQMNVGRGLEFPPAWAQRFVDVLNGGVAFHNVIEMPNFEPDQIKVELVVGGRRRTVDLNDTTRIRAWYDITDQIEINASGHATFGSIDVVAKAIQAQIPI